jgi:hypothetical protein
MNKFESPYRGISPGESPAVGWIISIGSRMIKRKGQMETPDGI